MADDTVIKFSHPAVFGATCWHIFRGGVVWNIGKLFRWLGVPGALRNVEISDDVSGQRISISVGVLFTKITVNGRDYYFRRFSGLFDGTGSSLGCQTSRTE